MFKNFFSKFSAQCEKPSLTRLYAVTPSAFDKVAGFPEKIIGIDPDDKILDRYKVKPEAEPEKQFQRQQKRKPLSLWSFRYVKRYRYLFFSVHTVRQVIVDKPGSLQVGVTNRSSEEFESPLFHIPAHGIGFGRGGRNLTQ